MMAKRSKMKVTKRAEQKVIGGHVLTPKERIAFRVYMESWLGPEIVGRIKKLRETGKQT